MLGSAAGCRTDRERGKERCWKKGVKEQETMREGVHRDERKEKLGD